MLESLFNEVAVLGNNLSILSKGDSNTGFSCEICKNFEDIFFNRTPPVAASAVTKIRFKFPGYK